MNSRFQKYEILWHLFRQKVEKNLLFWMTNSMMSYFLFIKDTLIIIFELKHKQKHVLETQSTYLITPKLYFLDIFSLEMK